ncbi:MAG: glycerate kinase, partial [Anaerolineales bacterium]
IVIGDHPIPGENSLLAGQRIKELIEGLTKKDLIICLISGGGSSLIAAPHVGLSLNEVTQLYTILIKCGASIDEINTVRRHLDQLKGGGLIRKANGARVISLILSDVIGNPLEAIASGPTAPDPTTKLDALAVLHKYHLIVSIPAAIPKIINSAQETAKPGDRIFDKVSNYIIGSNEMSVNAAITQAKKEGYHCRNLGSTWQNNAQKTAMDLCAFLENPGLVPPCCLIGGGETSVNVKGKGRGGRNQELALAAVKELAGKKDVMLISLATDGEEGVTDAAGAVTSNETLQRANNLGMDVDQFLAENDSYTYFESLGDLIRIGPTGTNVNDLFFLICD